MIRSFSEINLPALMFQGEAVWTVERSVNTKGAVRDECVDDDGERMVVDRLTQSGVRCGFLRLVADQDRCIRLAIPGSHGVKSCLGGGWLLEPDRTTDNYYWIAQAPTVRKVTNNEQITNEIVNPAPAFHVTARSATVELNIPGGFLLDLVAWEISFREKQIIGELSNLTTLETQPIFLWGSHTLYQRPVDVYQHLIFGHVYENRYLWPYNRKSCSENDAHALYVTLSGLQRATSKKLYALLKEQLLISVLARQAEDGGWHHGEWSEDMEAHMRLNGSAIHLLMDSLDERDDPTVRQALERAVSFVARHCDETAVGAWFLHDSLELTEAAMKKSPFRWQASRVLGKSVSNMLVLNTHLDILVLMDRYRQVTGDARYQVLVDSAKNATRAVLNLRPLESVYRLLLRLVRLNLLPLQAQMSLPLPLRALKRLGWQWLGPNLFRLTARFPRLIMPGGYIERAVTLCGMADGYHSINVMDLGRYWRRFPEEKLAPIILQAVEFIRKNQVDSHWGESKWNNYPLGFWAEALYHVYSLTADREILSYLAKIMIKLEEHGIGLPPSLLGANAEAVPLKDQIGCPCPADKYLRVANLSRNGRVEFVVVNPTEVARELTWESIVRGPLAWHDSLGNPIPLIDVIVLSPKGWVIGQGT